MSTFPSFMHSRVNLRYRGISFSFMSACGNIKHSFNYVIVDSHPFGYHLTLLSKLFFGSTYCELTPLRRLLNRAEVLATEMKCDLLRICSGFARRLRCKVLPSEVSLGITRTRPDDAGWSGPRRGK